MCLAEPSRFHNYLSSRSLCTLTALCWLYAAALAARASEIPSDIEALRELDFEQLLKIEIPTVYGASKHDQKVTEAPSSISIITRDEIQKLGHRNLADVLRSVRDFYVTYDYNYSYIGTRGFNRPGDYGGRILLLIDGHRTNEPIYDTASVVSDFPLDIGLVERVEVIRGPGSSLYGSNAFFAVINVITRKGGNVDGFEATGEAGSLNTYKGTATYGKAFENGLSLLLSGTAFDSQGNERLYFRELDRPESNRGVAESLDGDRYHSQFATISYKDFTLQASHLWRWKDVPTAPYGTAFNARPMYTNDERSYVRLNYDHEFQQELKVHASIHWDHYSYTGDYTYDVAVPGEPRLIRENRDLAKAEWWGLELRASKRLFKAHLLTLGADFQNNYDLRLENFDFNPHTEILNYRTSNRTFGVYLQDEWAITSKFTLNAGLRYDWFETFGSMVDPRAALIYRPSEKTALKLLYGQAFRAPNLAELYYSPAGLRPERITTSELVLEQSLTSHLRLSASAFYNRISDLITERPDVYSFYNLEGAYTKGTSIELQANLPGRLQGKASYTWQNTEDLDTGERLSNSPEHLAKLSLIVPIYRDRLTTGLELQYTSKVHNTRNKNTSGYPLVNWTLFSRELVKGVEITGSIHNLFDEDYGFPGGPEHIMDTLPQEGRTFRVKVTWKF